MRSLRSRLGALLTTVAVIAFALSAKVPPFADDVLRAVALGGDDAGRVTALGGATPLGRAGTAAPAPPTTLGAVRAAGVAGRYDRAAFGYTEATRHAALKAHAVGTNTVVDASGRVPHGMWRDAYTGEVITDVSNATIDHVIALKWAWEHGASHWPPHLLHKFGNDPRNIVITLNRVNGSKGTKGRGDWVPADPQAAKSLLARQDWVMKT